VLIEKPQVRAILEGDNSDSLSLAFVANGEVVQVGDRVVTSGHGGMFPAGISVGVVSEIDKDIIRVVPLVDFGTVEFVRVLRFDFPSLEAAPGGSDFGGRK
jgi:rod shape-determining protein MreC